MLDRPSDSRDNKTEYPAPFEAGNWVSRVFFSVSACFLPENAVKYYFHFFGV